MSRFRPRRAGRPGMSLVELLVVIGVLLLLLVTVIPILSPTADQKGREAAATVLSMINRAKLRAENNGDTGAGLWLEPLTTTGSLAGPMNDNVWWQLDGQVARMATLDMFACEPQNAYNGDNPDEASVLIYPINETPPGRQFVSNVPPNDYLALFQLQDCVFIREFCGTASRITVDTNDSYFFRLLSRPEQDALQANPSFFPRPYRECLDPGLGSPPVAGDPYYVDSLSENFYSGKGNGFSPNPTNATAPQLVVGWVRPIAAVMGGVAKQERISWLFNPNTPVFPVSKFAGFAKPFAIHRPNVRSPTPPLSVPEGYAIDVSWSSIGSQLFHNSVDVRLGQGTMTLLPDFLANQPVQFIFQSDGSLKKVVYKAFLSGFGGGQGAAVEKSIDLPADIFLLVGRADRVGLPYVANPTESTPGANWQYPDSRWVKISHQTGKTLIADPVLDVNNVYDSQGYARADVAAVRN